MKKVNEKRWALVDEDGYVDAVSCSRDSLQEMIETWSLDGQRVARVQITEIEEVEDDKG